MGGPQEPPAFAQDMEDLALPPPLPFPNAAIDQAAPIPNVAGILQMLQQVAVDRLEFTTPPHVNVRPSQPISSLVARQLFPKKESQEP